MGKFSWPERSVAEERSMDEKQQKSRNKGCKTPSRDLGKAEMTQAVGTGLSMIPIEEIFVFPK